MVGQVSVMSRRAFQQNHFLIVDAGETGTVGLHQFRPLVDAKHTIRTVGENELPDKATVEDLSGAGYCSVPNMLAVRANGLIDVRKADGVMHRFAGLCAAIMHRSGEPYSTRWRELLGADIADSFKPINATEFVRIAKSVADAVPDSALSMDVSDGALYVTKAELGAQIYVEWGTDDSARGPQDLFTNGMYTFNGTGPLHIVGGAEAIVVSRSSVSFKEGTQEDWLHERYGNSGMPEQVIEGMRMHVEQEDSTVVFLTKGDAEDSLPIPNHAMMMRAIEGAVDVWKGDRLIHVLEEGSGTTLLCHPDAGMVNLKSSSDAARLLKIPFKLS